jgi:hypothetical protein
MVIRNNVSIGRDNDTAADSMLDLRLRGSLPTTPGTEELRKARGQTALLLILIVRGSMLGRSARSDGDIDDCGSNAGGNRFDRAVDGDERRDAVVVQRSGRSTSGLHSGVMKEKGACQNKAYGSSSGDGKPCCLTA